MGNATYGGYDTATIDARTTTSWNISLNGPDGTSPNQFSGPAHYVAAGTETTDTTSESSASARYLQFRDLSGVWHNKWESAGPAGKSVLDPAEHPLWSQWVDPQYWMQSGENSCTPVTSP